jgi:LruC domain-containing protein
MTLKYFFSIALSALALISACRKPEKPTTQPTIFTGNLDEDTMPPGFNYRTTQDLSFQIQLNAPDGSPIVGIPIHINKLENDTLTELFAILTDQNGLAEGLYNVPYGVNEVVISPNYVGVPDNILIPLTSSTVSLNISGARVNGSGTFSSYNQAGTINNPINNSIRSTLNYKYLSTYNSQGVPSVMASNEIITAQMLSYINNSVPEHQPVPVYHPNYLNSNVNTDLDITQAAEVWITFVHEGAGYKNALGYYKYATSSPPSSVAQIDTVYMIFPNASYYNSGGGLHSGNRVAIGSFPAGTSIGFVCISNGWNGSSVGNGSSQLFSDKNLNSTSNPNLKQQSIMLFDNTYQQYYICFEDIKRDNSACDNDFNDLVFYAKANPITAISNLNVAAVDNGIDTDADGVSDVYDDFPNDASYAYRNYYPSAQTYGTLAFEDLWPGKGDYDFNDLVVGYQFEQWLNALNKVKEMKCRFAIRAIGAHYKHGFGFQMNVNPSDVGNVSGVSISDNLVTLSANGTEAGQTKATIIAFDNDYHVMNRAKGNSMNTDPLKPYQKPDTLSVDISFATPQLSADLGTAPFNPFIYIDGNRGKEVHLPGYLPTSLANSSYFRTYQDNTSPGQNIYYKTKNNLPFALNLPSTYSHLLEREAINHGYLKFVPWVQSNGNLFPDWYSNMLNNYRQSSKIYMAP